MIEADFKTLGYFGNVWVMQNHFKKAQEIHSGHAHEFDHVSLIASGKVRVEVEGYPPKEFTGPTFIIIRKNKVHNLVALEDDTVVFCIFALPESVAGADAVYSNAHDPLTAEELATDVEPEYREKMRILESKTVKYT